MNTPADIAVRRVQSRQEMRRFIRFPLDLYRGDRNYVPHLLRERKRFFNPQKNPLFAFTDVEYFLAYDDCGEVAGRISAHINRRHNEYWNESAGCFGFFESIPRFAVASQLLTAAETWLRERGACIARGPFNFSTNEECGFLATGHDSPPAIMMTYTKPYYLDYMENLGFRKVSDLLAFTHDSHGQIPEYLVRFSNRVRQRLGVRVRQIDMSNFSAEIETVLGIYNRAWQRNWGFVPMTEGQCRYMASELRPVVDPAVALIAEKDGQPIAFSLSLPDYNQILRHMNGRLLPFGWVRLLTGRRNINRGRVIALGVVEEYRNRGVDALLYHDTFQNGHAKGYYSCEMSWILENNVKMIRALERMGGRCYKTYRIYEKQL